MAAKVLIQDWMIPHIVSYLNNEDLICVRHIAHFWNQCVIESVLFPRISSIKCKSHQHRPSKILIVGDGNFSFSLALCRLLPSNINCSICSDDNAQKHPLKIVTSTMCKNLQSLSLIHPSSAYNIEQIETNYPFCSVLFGVDATNLSQSFMSQKRHFLDLIIFNFPHSNNHRHIDTNRNLLRSFFESSAEYLCPNGIVCVRLCLGQGGTPKEEEILQRILKHPNSKAIPLALAIDESYRSKSKKRASVRLKCSDGTIKKSKIIKVRSYANSWKIIENASYSNFILADIRPFYWNIFKVLGYEQTGRKGKDNLFLMDLSLTHSFVQSTNTLSSAKKLFPMTLFRDISFWISDEYKLYIANGHSFEAFVYQTLGKEIVFKVEYLNRFKHPKTGRQSKTFRIWYKDKRNAFNRYKCNELQSKLRDALRDQLNVGVANHTNQKK